MRARIRTGSVVLDKRTKRWTFFWWEDGKRHSKAIGTLKDLPTKADAWRAARPLRDALETETKIIFRNEQAPTVKTLVEQYRAERMPQRKGTKLAYSAWLKNHIVPRWGGCPITELQARPVELWLGALPLSPKSRVHIRGVITNLWNYAMWRGDVPTQRNPMELVTIKGATKRKRQPRSLTVEEFRSFAANLGEPFRTIALLCVCLGLRISECLALRWSDVDWLNGRLRVERGIVCQKVDDVKTSESRRSLHIDGEMMNVLKLWKQTTQFSANEDWMFASPVQSGRLPWSYDQV